MSVEDIFNKAKDIAEGVSDTVSEFKANTFNSGKQLYQAVSKPKDPIQLDDDDVGHVKKIQEETGFQKVGSLLGPLSKIVLPKFAERFIDKVGDTTGLFDYDGIKYKSGVDRKTFEENYNNKRTLLNTLSEKLVDTENKTLALPQFSNLNAFLTEVSKLKEEGMTDEQAMLLAQQQFSAAQLKKIQKEQESYATEAGGILDVQNEYNEAVKDLKRYTHENVDVDDDKALDLWESSKMKTEGTEGVKRDLILKAGSEVDVLLGDQAFLSDKKADPDMLKKKERLVELFADLEFKRISALSETPEDEVNRINGEYKAANESMKKFYINQYKQELALKTKYKDVLEKDDLEKQAAMLAYNSLSEEDQANVKHKKMFDAMQSFSVNSNQLKENLKDGEYLRAAYNFIESTFNATGLALRLGTQSGRDDITSLRVGNPVINADNSGITEFLHAMYYNPSDVLNTALSLGVGPGAEVAGGKAIRFGVNLVKDLSALRKASVVLEGSIAGQKTLFALNMGNKLGQAGARSIGYGVAPNTAIDLAVGEIGTKAQDDFNMLTDLFFDASIFTGAKGVSFTRHDLLDDFMFGESKKIRDEAIAEFTKILNERGITKNGKTFDTQNTKELLRDEVIPLYKTTLKSDVADKVFNRGEIFDYVTNHLKKMDEAQLKTLFTNDGHIIKSESVFESVKNDVKDLFNLGEKVKSGSLTGTTKNLYEATLNKRLVDLEKWVEGKGSLSGSVLKNVPQNLKTEFKSVLEEVRKGSIEIYEDLYRNLTDKISALNANFGSAKFGRKISVTNAVSGVTINLDYDQLEKLAEHRGKTTQELFDDGVIEITKKERSEAKLAIQEGQYVVKQSGLMNLVKNTNIVYKSAEKFLAGKVPVESIQYQANRLATEFKQLVTGLSSKSDGKGIVKTNTKDYVEGEIEFIMDELRKIFDDNISMLNLGNKNLNIDPIKEAIEKEDSFFTMAYGSLPIDGKNQPRSNEIVSEALDLSEGRNVVKYILPGKKLLDSEIGNFFLSVEKDNFSRYANTTITVLRNILKNSKVVDGKIDYIDGISKLDALNSYKKYEDIFDKDGRIDTTKVKQLIKEALYLKDRLGEGYQKIGSIEKVVMDVISNFGPESNKFIGTVIKNLTHKISRNFSAVEKLVMKGTKDSKMQYLKKLILDENGFQELSKQKGLLSETEIKHTDLLVKAEYEKIILRNRVIKDTLVESIDNLKRAEKDFRGAKETRDSIKKDRLTKEAQLKKVEKNLTMTEDEFRKKASDVFFSDDIYNKLDASINSAILSDKDVVVKQISSYEDHLAKLQESLKIKKTISEKDLELVSSKVQAIKQAKTVQEKFNLLKELESDQTIKPNIKTYIKNHITLDESKFKDVAWVDEAKIVEDITTKMNLGSGIYDLTYTKENNPIERVIREVLSKKANIEGVEDNVILGALNRKFGNNSKTINDLYSESEDFRKVIEGMQYSFTGKVEGFDKEDIYKIGNDGRKAFEKFLKEILDDALDGVDLKAIDGLKIVDVKKELLEQTLRSQDVYESFKRLSLKKKYDFKNLSTGLVDIYSKELGFFKKKLTNISDSYYDDQVLRVDEMLEKMPGVGFIKISGVDAITSIELNNKKTIGKIIDDATKNYRVYTSGGDEIVGLNDVKKLDIILHAIEGEEAPYQLGLKRDDGSVEKLSSFNKALSTYVKEIREKLGLKEGETILGTFGDKDTFLQKYDFGKSKKSFIDKQNEYEKIYAKAVGYEGLDSNKIAKRETFNVSNYSTFDKVNIPIKTYILKEVNQFTDKLKNLVKNKADIDDIKNQLAEELPKDVYDDIIEGLNGVKDPYAYFENTIVKDFNDGTSWATRGLWQIRNKIQGLDANDRTAFKDHFYGLKDGKIYGGKTLFNKADGTFTVDGVDESYAIAIGESSLKLEKQMTKSKAKKLVINGREYDIVGEIEGATTQDFKNAASDTYEIKEEQSVALQILNGLPVEHQEAIAELLKEEIDIVFQDRVIEQLGSTERFNTLFKDKTTQEIQDIISRYIAEGTDIGTYSDNLLNAYARDFLGRVEQLINKGTTPGETVFMQEVDPLLKNGEIILSEKNPIVQRVKEDMEKRMRVLPVDSDEYLKLETKLRKKEYEILGYRYPVASKYNLGVYRIKVAEKLPEDSPLGKKYRKLDEHSVIMSPYAVFIKKEGDFDGDHLYMISAHSEKGKILSKAALGESVDLSDTELLERFDNIRNRHITTEQVEGEKPTYNLYRARMVALEAKKAVGHVSAGIRTMRLLTSLDKSVDRVLLSGDKTIKTSDLKNIKFRENLDLFDEEAASILQIALDFAKSGKSEFPSDWVKRLYDLVIDDPKHLTSNEVSEEFRDFIENIFTPLSTAYGSKDAFEMKDLFDLGVSRSVDHDKVVGEYLSGKLGVKGDLYKYTIDEYLPHIQKINLTNDLGFILDTISTKSIVKESDKALIDSMVTSVRGAMLGKRYLNKKSKTPLVKKFLDEITKTDNQKLKDLIKDYYQLKETGLKPYEAANLVGKASLGDYATRYGFALFSLMDGNSKIFDLLLAKEKLEFIKYSDKMNRKNLNTFMKEYEREIPKQVSIGDIGPLNKQIEDLENLLKEDDSITRTEVENIVKEIDDLKKLIEDAEIKQEETRKEFSEKLQESDTIRDFIEVEGEFVPRIDFDLEVTKDALNDIVNQYGKLETVRKGWGRLVLADILNKYNPLLMERIDMISSELNTLGGEALGAAYKKNYLAVSKLLKTEFGLRKDQAESFMKSIDGALTSFMKKTPDGYTLRVQTDTLLDEISARNINQTTGLQIVDAKQSKKFSEAIEKYKSDVIDPIVTLVNKLESQTKGALNEVNIAEAYISGKKKTDTLFKDVIEAIKSDYTFALRTAGIYDKTDAIDTLKASGMGERNASIIANTLYPNRVQKVEGFFNAFNALHYLLGYGLVNTLTHQKGQIMGFVQLLPNFVQIMSKIALHQNELFKADLFIKEYGLLGSEDLIRLSLGYDSEISKTGFMNTLARFINIPFEKMGEVVGKDFNRTGKYVESFLMSPLTFFDAPLEGVRKRAALIEFAHTLGMTVEDLPKFINARLEEGYHMQDIKNLINSGSRNFYAKTGGGVVSSSQLHRKTLLNTMDIYGEEGKNVLPRIFMSAVGYLNGWAFHNTAQYLDNQLSFLRAGKYLTEGNYKGFRDEMNNWLSYNASMLYMTNNAVGLYLKAENHEVNPDDKASVEDFYKAFNNILVSKDILLGQVMESSEIASRYGDTSQVLGYTAYELLKRYTRTLAVVPNLVTGAIDAYKFGEESDNIVERVMASAKAVSDTINSMNDSYMRYIGYQAITDSYDTVTDRTNISLLGLGGNTTEDDIFEYHIKSKQFYNFDKKGFLGTVSDMIVNRFTIDDGKYSVTAREVKKIMDEAHKREGTRELLANKGITNEDGDGYNLQRIVGRDAEDLSASEIEAINNLYNEVAYDYSKELDSKGRNLYKYGDVVSDDVDFQKNKVLDDMVTSELRDRMRAEGLDFDQIVSAPSEFPEGYLKLQALAEYGGNLGASQINAYSIQVQQSKLYSQMVKTIGRKDELGKSYLTEYEKSAIKRQVLLDHAKFLNMDATAVHKVMEIELKNNHPDLYSPLNNATRDKKIINEANRMLANEYLATRNLQRGDTSVGALTSRWSTLFKGFDGGDEMMGNMIIKTMIDIENSSQDPKTKLAKKAAAIIGMDKASYGLLRDDKRFEALSYNTKKVITNWMYDTSIKSVEYDANSILKDIVNSAQGSYKKKGYPKRLLNNGKGGNYNDARPNFSKQFKPLQNLIPSKSKYISPRPGDFIGQASRGYPQGAMINNFKTPIMKDYQKIKIDTFMPELFGKDIIKATGVTQELAKQKKRTIMLKPKRKVKNPKRVLPPVRTPKPSLGLLSNKPFNYD